MNDAVIVRAQPSPPPMSLGRNESGPSRPSVGCSHRTRASKPTVLPAPSSIFGWYIVPATRFAMAASSPPAENPITPMRPGSIFQSGAWLRTKRMERWMSYIIAGC